VRNDEEGSRFVEVQLGFDRFEATIVTEACRAEGFDVQPLLMDSSGAVPGRVALVPHRMLAREADLEAVTRIVNRSSPQA